MGKYPVAGMKPKVRLGMGSELASVLYAPFHMVESGVLSGTQVVVSAQRERKAEIRVLVQKRRKNWRRSWRRVSRTMLLS